MQKHVLLILAALVSSISLFQSAIAQNGTPYWSTLGNSNATSSSKLGTTNAINLRLYTNNIERVRITTTGLVGIGTTTPTERLQVNSAADANPFRAQVNGNTKLLVHRYGGVAIGANVIPPANGLYVAGSVAIGTNSPLYKLHVLGTVYGESSTAYGVYGYTTAVGSDGVHGSATAGSGYGVFASSDQSFGLFARTSNTASYAGYFSGNVYTTGAYLPSARKLKQNIAEIHSAMALVSRLQPKEYEYKQEGAYKLMNLPQGRRYGLIAEEVEEVLPGLVKATTFEKRMTETADALGQQQAMAAEDINFKAVNYTELIPIIIKGMQELSEKDKEIDALKEEVAELRQMVLELKGGRGTILTSAGSLGQNTPNPVNGTTIIRYHTPEASNSARVVLTNTKGQIVKAINISNRGSGQINLNTQALAAGTYNYTLYVDGQPIETKRLVVVR
jgi:hypothetical protein